MGRRYDIAAITKDIYTKEDAEFLARAGSLAPERILGVETKAACTPRFARMPRSISPPSRRWRKAIRVSN